MSKMQFAVKLCLENIIQWTETLTQSSYLKDKCWVMADQDLM